MSRAAIILAIIFTFPFSSLSLAASDEEINRSIDKMSAAFRCSTYAQLFQDQKEQQRLFQIGLKAARNFWEGVKSGNDPALRGSPLFLLGISTDFAVGTMWERETTKAYDEIVKNGLPPKQWLDADAAKTQAELRYRQSNCSLIN